MTTPTPFCSSWRRSSRSGHNGDNCVEIAALDGVIAVRDSKNTTQSTLTFEPDAWYAFVRRIKST